MSGSVFPHGGLISEVRSFRVGCSYTQYEMERSTRAARRAANRVHMQVVIQQDPTDDADGSDVKNVVHVVIEDGDATLTGQEIRLVEQQENAGAELLSAQANLGGRSSSAGGGDDTSNQSSASLSARPYPCAFCTSRFKLKSSLRRHVRSQHANHPEREVMLRKAFECRQCHSEFGTNSDLWFHRQTVHGSVGTPGSVGSAARSPLLASQSPASPCVSASASQQQQQKIVATRGGGGRMATTTTMVTMPTPSSAAATSPPGAVAPPTMTANIVVSSSSSSLPSSASTRSMTTTTTTNMAMRSANRDECQYEDTPPVTVAGRRVHTGHNNNGNISNNNDDDDDDEELDDEHTGFTCVLCSFTYRKVQDLKRHIRRRHPEALSKTQRDSRGKGLSSSLLTTYNGDLIDVSEPVRICAITPANLHGDRVTRVPATTQLAIRCARSNGNTRQVVEELLQLGTPQLDEVDDANNDEDDDEGVLLASSLGEHADQAEHVYQHV